MKAFETRETNICEGAINLREFRIAKSQDPQDRIRGEMTEAVVSGVGSDSGR